MDQNPFAAVGNSPTTNPISWSKPRQRRQPHHEHNQGSTTKEEPAPALSFPPSLPPSSRCSAHAPTHFTAFRRHRRIRRRALLRPLPSLFPPKPSFRPPLRSCLFFRLRHQRPPAAAAAAWQWRFLQIGHSSPPYLYLYFFDLLKLFDVSISFASFFVLNSVARSLLNGGVLVVIRV